MRKQLKEGKVKEKEKIEAVDRNIDASKFRTSEWKKKKRRYTKKQKWKTILIEN